MILNFVGEGDFFIGGTVVYAFYTSLTGGNHVGTKEEYASYKAGYTKQASDIRESVRVLREKLTEVLENRSERNRCFGSWHRGEGTADFPPFLIQFSVPYNSRSLWS